MLPIINNYPPRYLKMLKEDWISTAKCLSFSVPLLLIVIYFAIFQGLDMTLAAIVSAFLLLLSTVYLWGSISGTLHVRLVPILENNQPGVSPYQSAPLGRTYLMNKQKGRAIAENYQLLAAYSEQLGIPALGEFGEVNGYAPNNQYFDPHDAIEPIQKLLAYLKQNQGMIEKAQALIQDLSDIEAILKGASENELLFCFAIY